jgi:1-deoxy-D-xylulose-5-phosphate reductoisomerase
MVRRITILGATGSIGQSAACVIDAEPERFDIHAVTAGSNAEQLAEIALRLNAKKAVIRDPAALPALKEALAGKPVECAGGDDALEEIAGEPVDMTLSAIVGAAGVRPTAAAVRAGNTIALANKECLTCAGTAFIALAAAHDVRLLPVDSEHNAVFQLLQGKDLSSVGKITLTASGGPFRGWSKARLSNVTPDQAVAHPVWSMGAKISVDSATLMNKGLELIEAQYLFDLAPENLDVVIHPQSVIHAFVTLQDGSVHAEMGAADMRRPIAHCLYWPERREKPFIGLDLATLSDLTFEEPDIGIFPSLRLAREAMVNGRGAETVLNAANELAVASFLENRIAFTKIPDIVDRTLEESDRNGLLNEPGTVDAALELDKQAREIAARIVLHNQKPTS